MGVTTTINGPHHSPHIAHLNTSYRHFFLFIHEVCVSKIYHVTCIQQHSACYPQFDLVDKKELAPLDELNDAILAEDGKTR